MGIVTGAVTPLGGLVRGEIPSCGLGLNSLLPLVKGLDGLEAIEGGDMGAGLRSWPGETEMPRILGDALVPATRCFRGGVLMVSDLDKGCW